MNIEVTVNQRVLVNTNMKGTESDVFKLAGKCLLEINDSDIPGTMEVRDVDTNSRASFKLIKRGSVKHADGTSSPSLYVTEEIDTLSDKLEKSKYEDAYMVCINPTGNNYKFYWLRPSDINGKTHFINATYGRLGSEPGERFGVKELQFPYSSKMYWIRYYEKLSKGYEDMTDIYLEKPKASAPKKEEDKPVATEDASSKLYEMLVKFARHVVNSVVADPNIVTASMVEKSKAIYAELEECSASEVKDVDAFNNALLRLLMVCPRRVSEVQVWLADSSDDFETILDREMALINALEAVASEKTPSETPQKQVQNPWGMDIEIHYPDEEEKKAIVGLVAKSMQGEVQEVFMVKPQKQYEKFEKYCKDHNISKTESLFHGSGKENWYSITKNSLLLPQNNNARKTGQALGAGLYFGNHAKKSSHYTQGEDVYILGVFDVAYGKPMMIKDSDHNCYHRHTQKELDSKGCNSLHYTRIGNNWADEIVVFNEDAACLKALIVMKRH